LLLAGRVLDWLLLLLQNYIALRTACSWVSFSLLSQALLLGWQQIGIDLKHLLLYHLIVFILLRTWLLWLIAVQLPSN
jgi:hypothetical protein